MLTLEFVEFDDFVKELQERGITNVRLEMRTESGEPRGEFSNAAQSAFAVVTALYILPIYEQTVIAQWERAILVTDSVSYRLDKERTREKLFANFETVRQELETRGFTVKRGQWKNT